MVMQNIQSTISEMKDFFDGPSGRLDSALERISWLANRSAEVLHSELQREKEQAKHHPRAMTY